MHSVLLILKFVRNVFPIVDKELGCWQQFAASHGQSELSCQALSSIRDKKFHCQGGSIYGLYPKTPLFAMTRLIVALQTISDYLDNLCDRAGITDEQAFRQLHFAVTDALQPDKPPENYYQYYPFQDDGGYLTSLVAACQREIVELPSYRLVQKHTLTLGNLYSELQTYKHLDWSVRETAMRSWIEPQLSRYPGISIWEFAAATGSTLGMFVLCALAANPHLTQEEADHAFAAYFPWICGLHILLDYFIDREEDRVGGDLNFVAYYSSDQQAEDRLRLFWHQALASAQSLPEASFHETVVRGLFAMYLSDPKTNYPPEQEIRSSLLRSAGPYTNLLYTLCRLLRRQGVL
jgi:tetraprenyl-beta-curcumene synthase